MFPQDTSFWYNIFNQNYGVFYMKNHIFFKDKWLKIINEDVLKTDEIENNSIDLIVTSPPYNLGIKYSKYDDTISRQDYLDWMEEWAAVVKDVLSEKGSLFLNIGSKPSDPSVPFQILSAYHFMLFNL